MIITITGASGVGKTSILKELSKHVPEHGNIKVFHFDDIGIPDWSKVADPKKWQEETTIAWIDKLVNVARTEDTHIVFEGSTEIKFFVRGFEKNNFSAYKVLLLDCDEHTIKSRLAQRGQPELYTPDMVHWLHKLREDATLGHIEIIRTDSNSSQKIALKVLEKLNE